MKQYVKTEAFDDGAIVRITLDRVEARNAQNRGLLVQLDKAFQAAEADDRVRVIILAGAGPLFTAGHDLGSKDDIAERTREAWAAGYRGLTPSTDYNVDYAMHASTRMEPLLRDIRRALSERRR